ncbi:MAG: hypothetical protein F7C33_02960 [Desulfurococcales archaeon]|nr:hypothetical protein [Desulfurococcales archaeon]
MKEAILDERISRIFSWEIQRLVDEISWVDKRLAELDENNDEGRVERILLEALRRHLIADLRELGGFSGDPYLYIGPYNMEHEQVQGAGTVEA